jgi:hypothetical protein
VYGLLAGYEDLQDHDDFRHDPVAYIVAGRIPGTDAPLAEHSNCHVAADIPTLNIAIRASLRICNRSSSFYANSSSSEIQLRASAGAKGAFACMPVGHTGKLSAAVTAQPAHHVTCLDLAW